MSAILSTDINSVVRTLKGGGVIAYPTEACFGLGCDPKNKQAIERIISIKKRLTEKGLILIAANVEQAKRYVYLEEAFIDSTLLPQILASWPGPNTWCLPPNNATKNSENLETSKLLMGKFPLQAIRITAHNSANQLCKAFGDAIVSTSANVAGENMLTKSSEVFDTFGKQLDMIVDLPIGGDKHPSTIRNGLTGEVLRS